MIFVGDIALPISKAIEINRIPEELLDSQWVGNLEGSIVEGEAQFNNGLYNHGVAIGDLINEVPFTAFTLANNHIFDLGVSYFENTLEYLRQKNLAFVGAGKNIKDASLPIILHEGGFQIVIPNFGWSVIQCEPAGSNKPGVNPLTKDHVLDTVSQLLADYPEALVVPMMHWNYELEAEPQPFERELAKCLIDMGAAGVIGAHAHRVGGIEVYKGKPIVYSLGNWLFKQGHFKGGRVRFPEFCNLQLAFEWDFLQGSMKFHFFRFNPEKSVLSYSHTETLEGALVQSLTPFSGLSDAEYKKWYKKNHYHRRKGLPIYYWKNSDFTIKIKNQLNLCRDWLVGVAQSFKR